MQRIKSQYNVRSLPAPDENSYTPGYFSDGNAATGTKGTAVSAAWANGVQEELITVITKAGMTPDIADNTQLWQALKVMIVNMTYPVGSIYMSTRSTSPETLFGVGTWTRIKDRFLMAAGDVYAAGTSAGSATVTLAVKNLPSHAHGITVQNGGAVAAKSVTSAKTGAHAHDITVTAGGTHEHTGTSGSAGKHKHGRGSMEITGSFNGAQMYDDGWSGQGASEKPSATGAFTVGGAAQRTTPSHSADGSQKGFTFTASKAWTGYTTEQAAHEHSISVSGGKHAHTASCESKGAHEHAITIPAIAAHGHAATCASIGSGAAFSVLNPYYAVYMWRRTA